MSAPSLPRTAEERTVAILFCEVTASDTSPESSTRGLRDVLTPALRESFAGLLADLLSRHNGTFVTAVEDTSIVIFDSAAAAVEMAFALQARLAEPPRAADSKSLSARICVHYASVVVEETPLEPGTLAERVDLALRSPAADKRPPVRVKIIGKAVSFAARLLQQAPEGAITLSDKVIPELSADLAKLFVKQSNQPVRNSDGPALWVDRGHHVIPPDTDAIPSPEPAQTPSDGPPRTPPSAGSDHATYLGGRYRILSVLGQGGMGIVYRAKDERLDREVALKVRTGMTRELHRRFFGELQTVMKLNHPNIVSFYEVGQQDDKVFIVMELLRANSLAEVLASRPRLALAQTIDIVLQLCRALEYAHAQGIVHRDIKPANILVLDDGLVKVIDFGIARLDSAPADSITSQIVGTFAYISPERLKGDPGDGRADIWAAGVVLYQMLTGSLPFPGDGLSAMYSIVNEPFAPLSTLAVEAPLFLDHILARALAKNPADRYANAAEMAADLITVTASQRPAAAPQLTREPTSESPRPHTPRQNLLHRFLPGRSPQPPTPPAAASPTPLPPPPPPPAPAPPAPSAATAAPPGITPAGVRGNINATNLAVGNHAHTTENHTAALDLDGPIDYASEAIVVIDIVQATATSDLFGWYSVGRHSVRHLRQAVREIGRRYGLACMKSTGDGLLLTYRDTRAADLAAVNALQASIDLLRRLAEHNKTAPEERQIAIRLALHFGEVDVLPDDREGPNVSFTFRVEAVSHASLDKALNPIDPALLPHRDYILCSERIHEIAIRRKPEWSHTSCGLFKLKGFSSWHELFLVSEQTPFNA